MGLLEASLKRQLWAGDAVGGGGRPSGAQCPKKYKAPGRARADCLFCPTTGRPLQRRKAKANSRAARSASRRGCRSPRGTAAAKSDARGLEEPEHLAALPPLRCGSDVSSATWLTPPVDCRPVPRVGRSVRHWKLNSPQAGSDPVQRTQIPGSYGIKALYSAWFARSPNTWNRRTQMSTGW